MLALRLAYQVYSSFRLSNASSALYTAEVQNKFGTIKFLPLEKRIVRGCLRGLRTAIYVYQS
jgi:hypothetical protein